MSRTWPLMAESDDLTPLPKDADQVLREARSAAVDLLVEVDDMEAELRDLRRRARARLKHYERLVQEHLGQLSLLEER